MLDDIDPLMPYKFLIELSDFDGAIIYNTMQATMGDFRPLNDNGALVFPNTLADPRGGMLTMVAALFGEFSDPPPKEKRHSCRYGKVGGNHMLFQAIIVKSAETDTASAASNKDTIGGKAGASYGIVSGEVSEFREHQGATGSVSTAYPGAVKDIVVVWIAK